MKADTKKTDATVVEDGAAITRHYNYGTWKKQEGWKPKLIVGAEGCNFTDSEGNTYLDFSSQLMCSNLGHGNRKVIDAIAEQARTLPYISPEFTTAARVELTKKLLEVLPDNLVKFFYGTSGTEANEAAVKIARMFFRKEGKFKIITRYDSYHGSTAASIALTGDHRRYASETPGNAGGVVRAPDPYCYRCPLGLKYPECGIACAEYVDYMFRHEGNVAAVMVEPVTGTNGVIVPPDGYMKRLSEITHEHGALLIADEVMSGWGRTGEWFAVNRWKVRPDILTTAKGITGAYAPLSLTATTKEIADYFEDNVFQHGHTYEAHPLTLLPAVAAIDEYKRLNLIKRSAEIGEYLGRSLAELKERHVSIGDVRGVGMFWAVELVKNRDTKEPFNTREDKLEGRQTVAGKVSQEMMKRGVYVNSWITHLTIAPPLIVTKEEIDHGIEVLDESLAVSDSLAGT
ncbi:MAG: aspartate aminotransferase family protein [Thermoplasmata archaeon]|nr:aspartate aminotransferase family protein [Candidatus Sysuiplasma acidicola]MBX8638675.1 aspartate aminotransferase family protein [Candidatus Sysuiplasma acidicola]MBX8646184.1 aspartate aminotransferase family protein [Candidatus Sysuiplasma acidicola]